MQQFSITQGIRGGNRSTPKEVSESTIRIRNNGNVYAEITVDNYCGVGANYQRREQPLINIQFPDGTIWSGTFEALQKRFDRG